MYVPHRREMSAGCSVHVVHVTAQLGANEIDSFRDPQPHGEVEFDENLMLVIAHEGAPWGRRKNERHDSSFVRIRGSFVRIRDLSYILNHA